MIKCTGVNRFEGKGIIERIEGNGWDIDANHIELNGINAQIIDNPENRIISLNGPAVEDLFKNIRDLLKENSKLREDIEKQDACINRLEHGLKEKDAGKMSDILNFTREAGSSNIDFTTKTFSHFIHDYDVTVLVSRKEEKDVEINKSENYDCTTEILRWLYNMIKNNTDYATKNFNKESKENIFSITFCKVPVEPEVVTNEQG